MRAKLAVKTKLATTFLWWLFDIQKEAPHEAGQNNLFRILIQFFDN